MSHAILEGGAGGTGSVTLKSPNTNSDRVLNLPDASGTVLYGPVSSTNLVEATSGPSNSAFSFRNKIINGDMRIDQRYNFIPQTVVAGCINDRWYFENTQSGTVALGGGASTTVPTGGGFKYSMAMYDNSGNTAPGAADRLRMAQRIEGLSTADLAWGTAGAKTITVSFWVRCASAGALGLSVVNAAYNRSYIATYTINSANTWEYKTITIPGDTSGTWATDNTTGIELNFDYGSGVNYETGSPNTWIAARGFRTSSCLKLGSVAIANSALFITGVQLEAGSVATPFESRPYGTELALCQRYAETLQAVEGSQVASSGQVGRLYYKFNVPKRAAPNITLGTSSNGTAGSITTDGFVLAISSGTAGPFTGNGGFIEKEL